MVFASSAFLFFLLGVLAAYWFLPRNVPRNLLLLAASWYFYAVGCWVYIFLLIAFTALDFYLAQVIERKVAKNDLTKAKALLALSLGSNLMVLAGFKFAWVMSLLGQSLLLPIGISFYTFQSISYVVDVFRRKIPAHRNFISYALYIAFFPQLLAGPIERAGRLLKVIETPWLQRKPSASDIEQAAWLIFWGLIKKVAIADRLAPFAAWSISCLGAQGGIDVWLGSIIFILQFFADFSAYTDIARGVALLFGIRLSENFRYPYFSTSPKEFWQRWHITLGGWFRDYCYGPLVHRGWPRWVAILVTMLLVGLWHGAQLKFLIWGLFWGVLIALDGFISPRLPVPNSSFLRFGFKGCGWLFVMSAWILSGFFFVAHDVQDAVTLLSRAFTTAMAERSKGDFLLALIYAAPLVLVETLQWLNQDRFFWFSWSRTKRTIFIFVLTIFFLGNYVPQGSDFIYFAF